MITRTMLAALSSIALTACAGGYASPAATTPIAAQAQAQPQPQAPVDLTTASIGAVSAADPRAQAAGEAILARGGNATDAAIAVMLALTVVEPQSSGIGGGGFLVLGRPDGTTITYDGRETAPAAATPDWFLTADGSLPPFKESVRSGLSVGVPGNIALAAKAHAEQGHLPWSDLFAPAIALARDGFQMNPRLNTSLSLAKELAGYSETGRNLFFAADGEPLPVSAVIRNEQLAATLESLAAGGREAFYSGPQALEIASAVAEDTPHTSAMTAEDVAGYEAKARDAICSTYRDYRICAMGPPTSGGLAVLQIVGQLERFDLNSMGVQSPVAWHLFVESQRLAYADRELYVADPDFIAVPVSGLTDKAYLAARSAMISPDSTLASVEAGVPSGASQALADGDEPEEHGTSHLAVVDAEETMVSYTSTIEGGFGSGIMVGGFYLNNELTDFSRSPEVDGKQVANRVEGGKRPRSSMSPVVIYDTAGHPFMAVGAAGGSTIPVQTARSIIGVIDFGLSAEDALGLPFIMAFGNQVLLEQGTWLEASAEAFRALGHDGLMVRPAPVKAGAVMRGANGWISARDPRLEGQLDMP